MDEVREYNLKFSLTEDEWSRLEKYAENEKLKLEDYLHRYFEVALLTALREGYVYDSFCGADLKAFKNQTESIGKGEMDSMLEVMSDFLEEDRPMLGAFWFDYVHNTLFGVSKDYADSEAENPQTYIERLREYWMERHRAAVENNDTRSMFYKEDNCRLIPRGYVFVENGKFCAAVGDWIDAGCIDREKLHILLEDEFNLPEDFEFRRDILVNIGREWDF